MELCTSRVVDGYSRLIAFLQCSTDNKAKTAISLFGQALEIYGISSRVRADKGGENTLIWRKMIELRREGRGGYINPAGTQCPGDVP